MSSTSLIKKFLVFFLLGLLISACTGFRSGTGSNQGLIPVIQNTRLGNSPVSQDAQAGTSRKNPIKIGTQISIPGWDVKVIQFLRGADALDVINTADWQAQPLPAGQEYVLAKVFVRNTSLDENYHSLGISQMFITGDKNVEYGDTIDGWPAPEFLFEDMFTAEAVEGWVDAVVPVDEHNMMLVLDVDENGVRSTRFFELERGASISIPKNLVNLKPTDPGINFTSPAEIGQQLVTPNWVVTIKEAIRGQEAESILQTGNSSYSPPESGDEYLLLNVSVQYINKIDLPFWLGSGSFYAVDSSGFTYNTRWIYLPVESDRTWVGGSVLPGAEVNGWVAVHIPAGSVQPVIAFDPNGEYGPTKGSDVRYVKVP